MRCCVASFLSIYVAYILMFHLRNEGKGHKLNDISSTKIKMLIIWHVKNVKEMFRFNAHFVPTTIHYILRSRAVQSYS